MPAKRELTIRQIRQMLRLARDGVSVREIGHTLGVARSTIQDNLKRATTSGLAWPLTGDLTDAVLEPRLFAHAGVKSGFRRRADPDWPCLACEPKRPGVNLMVLWEEYRDAHPDGYGYSRFCDLFREFERGLLPTMRQDHPAGDKVFIDQEALDRRSEHRRRARGRDLRRRAGGLELHLCRGQLDADAG